MDIRTHENTRALEHENTRTQEQLSQKNMKTNKFREKLKEKKVFIEIFPR